MQNNLKRNFIALFIPAYMFKTSIGLHDGNSWENFVQICLKHRYASEQYRRMDATVHGDFGIEGYTRTGKVFQCYCPDENTTTADLTTKQKEKIHKDLGKLITYAEGLKLHLYGEPIKEWILITPEYRNKDIHLYCHSKTTEYRGKGLELLHSDFCVLVHELDDYAEQIPIALQHLITKLDIQEASEVTNADIISWQTAQIEYTDNALRKYDFVLPKNGVKRSEKLEKMTNLCVRDYLLGTDILRQWEVRIPEKYESFVRLIGSFERQVQQDCLLNTQDPNTFYKSIKAGLQRALEQEFAELSTTMINSISNQVISKWMLECHIDFD